MPTQLRLQIDAREPFADGMDFGALGPYESLNGRVVFSIDPAAPRYREVVDLGLAPTDTAGRVTYETTFSLLKPVDLARGNHRLFYDVVNRGNKRLVQFFNDAPHNNAPSTAEHAGNGFLMRRGYSILWCGWQGDILPGDGRMTMKLPVATGPEGPLTSRIRAEFLTETPGLLSLPLSGNAYTRSFPAATLDTGEATLTYREYEREARQPIASSEWQFADLDTSGAVVPSATHCYLPAGFRPGWIYELIYTATSSLVFGLGFAAVRDLVSFLRYESHDADGVPNPLRETPAAIEKAYAWGRSQSGRFLREFVYRGWNQAPGSRRVFDGVWPHVTGAGRLALNLRFAQPDCYPRQHEQHLYPSDQSPFAYTLCTDPFSGRSDAILKRPHTDPLIIHTQTASEYWQRRGSLVHTDAFGVDLPPHPQARLFFFASTQHHAAPKIPPETGIFRGRSNPHQTSAFLRALLDALDAWASAGAEPPVSCVPLRAAATLVPADTVQHTFPAIAGVACPEAPNRLFWQDYGPDFDQGCVGCHPPAVDTSREYAVLVPSVDADGNDVAGLRSPDILVPCATYTGWNLRAEGYSSRAMYSIVGRYLPFAADAEARRDSGDPRPALTERYRSKAYYVRQVALAVQALIEAGLLLEEDADRYLDAAMRVKR